MKLQRQLIAIALGGGLALGAAQAARAETVYVVPAPQQPAVFYTAPDAYIAQTVIVPTYPAYPNTGPAPEIIIGRGARDTSNVYMYETRPYRYRPGFNVNTTPGYMGEQNARP